MTEENNIEEGPVEEESVDENIQDDETDPLDEAIKDRDNYKSIAQRAQADLVNYRTRAAQELEETRRNLKTSIFHDHRKQLNLLDHR